MNDKETNKEPGVWMDIDLADLFPPPADGESLGTIKDLEVRDAVNRMRKPEPPTPVA